MDSYTAPIGSYFMVTWTTFKNHLLEVGLTQSREDYDTINAYNRWFILFYHAWGPAWIKIHWNSIWLRTWSQYDFTLHLQVHDHPTWCKRRSWDGGFSTLLLLGSHNLMVTALGSCAKWPLIHMKVESIVLCEPSSSMSPSSKGHFTHEPRAMTMKLWEPKRKCPNTVPTHLHNHVVWSRILKCSVKSYVTGPLDQMLFHWISIHAGPDT